MIISSTISWQEQFAFRCNDDVCFILYKHAMFYLQSASSLMQQCVARHVPPYGHAISRFRSNQSLVLFITGACFAEKQQLPIL